MAPRSEPLIALAQATRQRFASQVGLVVPLVAQELRDHVTHQLDRVTSVQGIQTLRDQLATFELHHRAWVDQVRAALQQRPSGAATTLKPASDQLELMSDETVEEKLLASRLATRILESAGQEFANLRLRILFAEGRAEFRSEDPVRPEVLSQLLLQAWGQAGLDHAIWQQLGDVIQASLARHLTQAYAEANRFLVANGVMREIDFSGAVRKAVASPQPAGVDHSGGSGSGFAPTARLEAAPAGSQTGAPVDWWKRARQQSQEVLGRIRQLFSDQGVAEGALTGMDASDPGGLSGSSGPGSPHPLSQPHSTDRLHTDHGGTGATRISPQLQALLDEAPTLRFPQFDVTETVRVDPGISVSPADMERYVHVMRQRSAQLKQAADTPSEKATIEVVALMFQSILTEERLQPSLRVWFARLQIPVLRVALAEPEFFSTLQHPARRLIDRMGSCALGFDESLSGDSAAALDTEIRRVVQIIEQYPETGRRVFQLAYDEFQQFLARHLQTRGQASKLVTVAQQVEQKETLAIQYTIELRKQLDQMPVRDGIRDFLFKVWAEVLAVATVKHDAKHPIMATLKQTASNLLWAASAKPSRTERSQVIAQLPKLLAQLREGMGLLGMPTEQQEAHIKHISDVLADAFMSRTDTIPPEQLAAVTKNLSCLEDFLPQDGGVGDLELDQDSIELITGIDASNITIITHGGQDPGEAVRAWAMELQIGTWFKLDHNNQLAQVQLAWRSDRGQLCLFATAQQQLYLMQLSRVASYLQTGLLVPVEAESLTVRATRAALEKIEANPERLLA